MITTDFTNHKGMNVIGLLLLFVNSSPIALMEQLKNVPSMFHQFKNFFVPLHPIIKTRLRWQKSTF